MAKLEGALDGLRLVSIDVVEGALSRTITSAAKNAICGSTCADTSPIAVRM
jgi:hypothetical protein